LLISGYDKAGDPGARYQQQQIERARTMLTAYKEAQKRARKPGGKR
jgi:hypothetical protein